MVVKIMTESRYLTKTRFKLALECPAKLFYTGNSKYADQKFDDPFLLSLAKGGFQVGELAKNYFPGGVHISENDEQALAETNELLRNEKIVVFEAAVLFKDLFVRVDILVKDKDRLELIEVKSKSYHPDEDKFFGRDGVMAAWKTHLYDVAFQKHVLQSAFPHLQVEAFLMLTDKTTSCPTDGLNQKFRIRKNEQGKNRVELVTPLTEEEREQWILRKINVEEDCAKIFTIPFGELTFAEQINFFADSYKQNKKIETPVSSACKDCQFQAKAEDEAKGLFSGRKECWREQLKELNWTEDDFDVPTVLDIWDFRDKKNKMIGLGKIKMSSLEEKDMEIKPSDKSGFSRTQRQWLQVKKVKENDKEHSFDKEGLRAEMESWKFPLHFIDFETSAPAIPFNKGRHPYEGIAFQFSHHIVHEDGKIEHAPEFLSTEAGLFPNYDFIRDLRNQLSNDDGTIFQYSSFENSYLNLIRKQLTEDQSGPQDSEELIEFIRSITKVKKKKGQEEWTGPRCMVDMLDLVKRFYYDPQTNGSNSIKYVLPAILNASNYLKDRYSKPIYGTEIPSYNFPEGQIWVKLDGGQVISPYKQLKKMFADISDRDFEILSEDDEIREGGAAMAAYARLQFEDMHPTERNEIHKALLRYCELDTLAMVMIYEAWREMLQAEQI